MKKVAFVIKLLIIKESQGESSDVIVYPTIFEQRLAPTLDTFLFGTPLRVRLAKPTAQGAIAFFLLTTLLERRPCLVSV